MATEKQIRLMKKHFQRYLGLHKDSVPDFIDALPNPVQNALWTLMKRDLGPVIIAERAQVDALKALLDGDADEF